MHAEKQRLSVLMTLMGLSLALAGAGALILTDAGQMLRIGKSAVIGYFRVHGWIMAAAVITMLVALVLHQRWHLVKRRWMALFVVVVIGCLFATKFATPYIMFPSKQHSAEYRPVAAVEGYLEPSDLVYAVEHNGVVRAFPQKLIWQAHIFGGDYGGEDITFTYCVLTNLPVPYANDLGGEPMDLRVLAQTNNNLLLWDTRSGEIIQQITGMCELSKQRLQPLPVVQMSWAAYQQLHPDGAVAYVEFSSPLERLLAVLMPLEDAHGGENWMFPTVDLDDGRLPSKEKVIGVADGAAAAAYTRDYLVREGLVYADVGRRRLVLAHLPEHDVIVAFDRSRGGEALEITQVDYEGNTPEHGRLEPAFVHTGPMWAVWVHYFPQTELYR